MHNLNKNDHHDTTRQPALVRDIRALADDIGHDGLALAAIRRAQADLREALHIDEHLLAQDFQAKRAAHIMQRHVLGPVREALARRDAAITLAQLRAAEVAVQRAWAEAARQTNEAHTVACPPAKKTRTITLVGADGLEHIEV